MSVLRAVASGFAGACALTLIHESARRALPDAPRMDVLGMRAIAKTMRGAGQEPPPADELHALALVGDVAGNSLYYSLVGVGRPEGALLRGTLLGLAAGAGALLLPAPLGLGDAPSARTPQTKAMTIGWYLAGGLAAGLAHRLLTGRVVDEPRRSPRRRASVAPHVKDRGAPSVRSRPALKREGVRFDEHGRSA